MIQTLTFFGIISFLQYLKYNPERFIRNDVVIQVTFKQQEQLIDETNKRLLKDINEYRKKYGKSPLQYDSNCAKLAKYYANELYKTNRFSHIDKYGLRVGGRAAMLGLPKGIYSENLQRGDTYPDEILYWTFSTPHRKAMLKNWDGVGFGKKGIYTVTIFYKKTF